TATHAHVLEQCAAAATALGFAPGATIGVTAVDTAIDVWSDLMLQLLSGWGIRALESESTSSLRAAIDRSPMQAVLASPQIWLSLAHAGWKAPRGLQILTRGGRLPQPVSTKIAGLGSAWSLLSAATAGGPVALAPLSPGNARAWIVAPLPGSELTVRNRFGSRAAQGVHGELSFRAAGATDWTGTGFIAQFRDGHFEIIGSTAQSVRFSGYRVRLGEIEDRLLELPDVSMARASVQNGPHGAPELVTYIAGFDGKQPDREAAAAHLRATAPQHLSRTELVAVPSIVCRPDGSPNLALLPRPDRARTVPADCETYVPAADDLESKLVAIWEEVLGVQGIGVRTSFFSLGGYSLMIVRLFARINKAFGTSLPITTIFNAPTIEQLAEILRGRKVYSALVPVQPGEGKPPLFLIHSYLLYAGLPSVLGKAYPFYGLRELDNEGEMTIEKRVASYIEAIRSVQPHGPYYIAGWCAAGPLTVEMARQLVASGEKMGAVILFDSWRPGYAREVATQQAAQGKLTWITRARWKYAFHAKQLRPLSFGGKSQYLWAAAKHKLTGMRDELYLRNWALARWLSKQLGFALPHFMHNISLDTLNAVAQYECDPFACRITLMRATESHHVPGAEPACGWGQIAAEGVEVLWAPGTHESMFKEPNLSVVGKMLTERLERAQQS
ncbi:phosphopantetheine-binding protein, partial [Silvibacterium sp.]|uniref:thioesterase domain-containing protein n=1 Tax=Silvibacterium sp. TaxID=1964179 RepID=UPI0039E4A608